MTHAPMRDLSGAVFLRREAIADGYTDRAIRELVKAGVWHRVRHGAYVLSALWAELDAAGHHRVRARAVLKTAHPSTVLSHVSAAIEHGAPVWDVDLQIVHVTRSDGKPRRREAGVVHHTGVLPEEDVAQVNGVPVTIPLRAAAEMTTVASVESALVTVDALLRLGRCRRRRGRGTAHDREPVASVPCEPGGRPGSPTRATSRRASRAPPYFSGRCTCRSPTRRSRSATRTGSWCARLDFAWAELGVFLEFDGKEKYKRFRREGETLDEFLMREKKREQLICKLTGWTCIRIGWAELHQPELLARRIRAILDSRRPSAS